MISQIGDSIKLGMKAKILLVFLIFSLISIAINQIIEPDSANAGPVGCEYEIPEATIDGLTVVFEGKVVTTETGEKVCRIDTSPY